MNWKLRLKNKTTLTALVGAVVATVYEILAILGIIPEVERQSIVNVGLIVVNCLCLLGIVVDPTTPGIEDSKRAMNYVEPGVEEDNSDNE